MKIYTKTGDKGETSLLGGVRVTKDDLRIRTYGTLDELNAIFGMILSQPSVPSQIQSRFLRIQSEIFQLGAELATPRGKKAGIALIDETSLTSLEQEIDEMEAGLAPLKNFVLPGGSPAAAMTHLARTVCRRAERDLVGLNRGEPVRPLVLEYVNRLSDYLFVSARWINENASVPETVWKGGRLV